LVTTPARGAAEAVDCDAGCAGVINCGELCGAVACCDKPDTAKSPNIIVAKNLVTGYTNASRMKLEPLNYIVVWRNCTLGRTKMGEILLVSSLMPEWYLSYMEVSQNYRLIEVSQERTP
jgi:hypothetical protein